MEPVSLTELTGIVGGELVGAGDEQASSLWIQNAAVHSNRIGESAIFFALQGTKVDGSDYAAQAFANGALAAVVAHDRVDDAAVSEPVVVVDDPLRALQRLAAWWRTKLSAEVIVIIGSSGKTVTKDALAHFASSDRRVYASPGSYNSQLGVALSVLDCPLDCDVVIIEAAATVTGEMQRLTDIVRPDNVVITNFTSRHRSGFANRAEHFAELAQVAESASQSGWVLTGAIDDDLVAKLDKSTEASLMMCNGDSSAPKFSEPRPLGDALVALVAFPNGAAGDLMVRSPSREIFVDIELALTAAWLLGITSRALLDEAKDHVPTSTRMEIWQSPGGATLMRDVATADPMAMQGGLRTAKRLAGEHGRNILVLGDPLENCSAEAAEALAGVIASEQPDFIFGLDVDAHRDINDALQRNESYATAVLFTNLHEMGATLVELLRVDDVALIHSPRNTSLADLSAYLVESMSSTRLYCDQSATETMWLHFAVSLVRHVD